MNWNPFKRIAKLEGTIFRLDAVIHRMMQENSERNDRIAALETRCETQSRWISSLEDRWKEAPANPIGSMTIGEFTKAKRGEYAKTHYAKKRAAKLGVGK